jgi:hypothetical protein
MRQVEHLGMIKDDAFVLAAHSGPAPTFRRALFRSCSMVHPLNQPPLLARILVRHVVVWEAYGCSMSAAWMHIASVA